MIYFDSLSNPIKIYSNDFECMIKYYKEHIKQAIITDDENFTLYVELEHLRLLNCNSKLDFHELIIIPIIKQIEKEIFVNRDKMLFFLKGKIQLSRGF